MKDDLLETEYARAFARLFNGTPYTFHRKEGFYPLILGCDREAIANAECNPGTVRVVNELTGKTVWAGKTAPRPASDEGAG